MHRLDTKSFDHFLGLDPDFNGYFASCEKGFAELSDASLVRYLVARTNYDGPEGILKDVVALEMNHADAFSKDFIVLVKAYCAHENSRLADARTLTESVDVSRLSPDASFFFTVFQARRDALLKPSEVGTDLLKMLESTSNKPIDPWLRAYGLCHWLDMTAVKLDPTTNSKWQAISQAVDRFFEHRFCILLWLFRSNTSVGRELSRGFTIDLLDQRADILDQMKKLGLMGFYASAAAYYVDFLINTGRFSLAQQLVDNLLEGRPLLARRGDIQITVTQLELRLYNEDLGPFGKYLNQLKPIVTARGISQLVEVFKCLEQILLFLRSKINETEAIQTLSDLRNNGTRGHFLMAWTLLLNHQKMHGYPQSSKDTRMNFAVVLSELRQVSSFTRGCLQTLFGEFELIHGDRKVALGYLEDAVESCYRAGFAVWEIRGLVLLAVFDLEKGETARARARLTRAQMLTHDIDPQKDFAAIQAIEGLAWAIDGDWPQARELWSKMPADSPYQHIPLRFDAANVKNIHPPLSNAWENYFTVLLPEVGRKLKERSDALATPAAKKARKPAFDPATAELVLDLKSNQASYGSRSCLVGDRPVLMALLELFIRNHGSYFSKEELIQKIWNENYNPLIHDSRIYVNVQRLRQLLRDDLKLSAGGDPIALQKGKYGLLGKIKARVAGSE